MVRRKWLGLCVARSRNKLSQRRYAPFKGAPSLNQDNNHNIIVSQHCVFFFSCFYAKSGGGTYSRFEGIRNRSSTSTSATARIRNLLVPIRLLKALLVALISSF